MLDVRWFERAPRATMRIDILSLFPQIASASLAESMMKRAQEKGLVEIHSHNLRDWCRDKHKTTDDAPYGGGPGMVMKCEPIFAAVEELRSDDQSSIINHKSKVVLMSPGGRLFTHAVAAEYAREPHLIILCGHYEGIDQRVIDHLVDDEISIGDYVLTNGALAAAVFIDAVVRLIPGVLGDDQSAHDDSHATGVLEFPQYTRPVDFRGWRVPDILLSGHHAAIEKWRREQALEKTRRVRPDLLEGRAAARPPTTADPIHRTDPSLPQRKHPAHPPPVEVHNRPIIILVTVVTKDRRPILANDIAHELIRGAWLGARAWLIGRYVIMPDHIHFFCAPSDPEVPLRRWISFWKDRLSKCWPRKTEVPIFQRDYWDRQLRRGEDYGRKWEYVRANPVRAGLVDDADAWAFQGEIDLLPW